MTDKGARRVQRDLSLERTATPMKMHSVSYGRNAMGKMEVTMTVKPKRGLHQTMPAAVRFTKRDLEVLLRTILDVHQVSLKG